MSALLIGLLPIGAVLLLSEYLWRKKLVKGERARKFIHILAGVYISFWPFYLPFDGIFILGFIALTVLIYSRYTRTFHAIYGVKRRTYGEIFFAIALIVTSYIAKEPWIFTVSILLLAVADGGAAVVGRLWGAKNQYFVFGYKSLKKSIYGTTAFIALAYVCIGVGYVVGGGEVIQNNLVTVLVVLPTVAVLLENSTPFGLDNLATPMFATLLLNGLL